MIRIGQGKKLFADQAGIVHLKASDGTDPIPWIITFDPAAFYPWQPLSDGPEIPDEGPYGCNRHIKNAAGHDIHHRIFPIAAGIDQSDWPPVTSIR
ncbi:hypothetical protein SXCC_02798 [Gluconacetobacter sp. SXCC-1]|nr:hypothetical protein SXCC_02798 [Gluconacetobacter sp. SXCC-1]